MGKKVKYGEFDPTESDGCTVVNKIYKFLTKEEETPFKDCCVIHDRAYWYGGHVSLRKEADIELRRCVSEMGFVLTAWVMYFAVRIFSGPSILFVFSNPLPWSWERKVTILPK